MATYFFDPSTYTAGQDPLTDGANQWDEDSGSALSHSEIANDGDGDHWHGTSFNDGRQNLVFTDVPSATELDIIIHWKGAGFRPTVGPAGFYPDITPWTPSADQDWYWVNSGGPNTAAGDFDTFVSVNGTETTIEAGGTGINSLCWIRFHLSVIAGDVRVQAKQWTGTLASEPGAWDLDTTDSTTSGRPTSGFCGLLTRRREFLLYWFGVGTGGDTAPGEDVGDDHTIVPAGAAIISVMANGVVDVELDAAGAAIVSVMANASITQGHVLTVQGAAIVGVMANAVVDVELDAAGAAIIGVMANASITQGHVLAAQGAAVIGVCAEAVVVPEIDDHTIVPAGAAIISVMANASITQGHVLAAQGAACVGVAANVTITQGHVLAAQGAACVGVAGNVTISQGHVLAIQGAACISVSANGTIIDEGAPVAIIDAQGAVIDFYGGLQFTPTTRNTFVTSADYAYLAVATPYAYVVPTPSLNS